MVSGEWRVVSGVWYASCAEHVAGTFDCKVAAEPIEHVIIQSEPTPLPLLPFCVDLEQQTQAAVDSIPAGGLDKMSTGQDEHWTG